MNEVKGYVNAQAMLEMLEQYRGCYFPHSAAVHIVNKLARTDVEPVVRAHWIEVNPEKDVEGWIKYDYKCSACDEISWEEHNYCPCCGAKMDAKVEYTDD